MLASPPSLQLSWSGISYHPWDHYGALFYNVLPQPAPCVLECFIAARRRKKKRLVVYFCQIERQKNRQSHTHTHTHTHRVWVSAPVNGFSEQRHDVCVTCLFGKAEINVWMWVMCVYLREREGVRLTEREWRQVLFTSCWKFNTGFLLCPLVCRPLCGLSASLFGCLLVSLL